MILSMIIHAALCDACLLRLRGFKENNQKIQLDMLKLSNFPIIEIDDQLYLREQKYADAENFFNYISKYEVRKYIFI